MTYDVMAQCADMILADAICDYAKRTGESEDAVREAFVTSPAYEALYDFETGLWQEGPDYFTDFFLRVQKNSRREAVCGVFSEPGIQISAQVQRGKP